MRDLLGAMSRQLTHVLFVLVLVTSLYTGIRGINFGVHWDEPGMWLSVQKSIDVGTLLPLAYNYPSLTYYLTLLSLVPDATGDILSRHSPGTRPGAAGEFPGGVQSLVDVSVLAQSARSLDFFLRARIVALVVSLAATVWVYLLVLSWRRRRMEALLAGSFVALSWEVAYHARWVAPDAIMMQFGALGLMFLVLCRNARSQTRWLHLSAIAIGLAAGTKYQGAFLLLPVLIWIALPSGMAGTIRSRLTALGIVLVFFAAAFLVTTPGAVLQPIKFLAGPLAETTHYKTGHMGYTVQPGIEHLRLMLQYLSMVALSRSTTISLFLFVMALIGCFALIREEKRMALVLLLFPIFYVAYVSTLRVMIVRNLLILIPFLSVFAARGWSFVQERYIHSGRQRAILPALGLAILIFNALWLAQAADSIVNRTQVDYTEEVTIYLHQHSSTSFLLSKHVFQMLSADDQARFGSMRGSDDTRQAIFFGSEVKNVEKLVANRLNRYTLLPSGPYEVNWDYYPTWITSRTTHQNDILSHQDRIVITSVKATADLGIAFHQK